MSVLLNATAPGATTLSFAAQQTFATGNHPVSVAVADVNGDGRPDLIVANEGDNTVSVLLNTTAPGATTPSFAAQQTFATGSNPVSVAAADVNGDGRPDLIVANEGDNTVSVLLNTTAPGASIPSFAAQQTFATGSQPESVAVADVNGDGRPDLIVANQGYDSYSVSVLLNATAPGATTLSFAAQQTFATGYGPSAVVAADVNGDGRPDIIVLNSFSATVSVLLNAPAVLGSNPATGTIDSAPVVSSFVLADPSPSSASTVHFTITFSEAVNGVTAANFILTGTAASGLSVGTPTTSDGGLIWTVPVTTGGIGTLGLNLNSHTGIVDSFGNQLYDTTSDNGSTFNPVVGPQYTIQAATTTTTTTVSSSQNPSTYGQSVTFTATVTGSGTPTGTVTFYAGAISPADQIGTGTLSLSVVDGQDEATFSTSTLTVSGSPYAITAVYGGDDDDQGSTSNPVSQTITPATLTVTAYAETKVYGQADPALIYVATGFQLSDTAGSVLTGGLTRASGENAGTYAITQGSLAADSEYTISFIGDTLTITPATLTVTADAQTKVYGQADPVLSYTPSGTLYYDDTYAVITGMALSTVTGAAATAGTHTITASGGTAANYAITDVNGTLTVSQAPLTVTADNQTKVYGAADPALTYTPSGTLYYDDTYAVITGVALSTATGAAATAGTHAITASGGVAANYAITDAAGILTVSPATLTVTANNLTRLRARPTPP